MPILKRIEKLSSKGETSNLFGYLCFEGLLS
jgi:hypothetical protein